VQQPVNTRRDFIRATAFGATAAALFPGLAGDAAAAPAPPGNAVADRHRNLFNGDTCVYFYNPELWQPEGGPFSAKAIHRYIEMLGRNGIDTFIINANASKAWYPSKTLPTIIDGYRRGDRDFFRGHAICMGITKPEEVEKFLDTFVLFFNQYLDLREAGVDWLAETSKACREHGTVPWVDIRMNDLHGHRNFQGSFFNSALLKREEMRLHRSTFPSIAAEATAHQGLNYEHPEVRDFMFAQIREVVEDYDFEGLELDWWRQPLCCEPNASPQTVEMMSDWFRDVRALTERRAAKNGRPYYFGMRIPGRLETLKSIGIDLVTLCREGTVDFICPSGYWCTTWTMPHDDLRRQLGERVRIYGVIEDGANSMTAWSPKLNLTRPMRYVSASREMIHANAAGKLVLGAAGIEWFNFFCTDQARLPGLSSDYAFLRDVHRLEFLRGREKHYMFPDNGNIFLEMPPHDVPSHFPASLEPHRKRAFRLPMCAEPGDGNLRLVAQVVLMKSDPVATLLVSFNGSWPEAEKTATDLLLFPCGSLTHHTEDHAAFNFQLPAALIHDGWNEVVVENGAGQSVDVAGIELAVMKGAATG